MGLDKNTKKSVKRAIRFRSSVDNFHSNLKSKKLSKNPSERYLWDYHMYKFIKDTVVNFKFDSENRECKMVFNEKKYIRVYNLSVAFEINFLPWVQYIKFLKNEYPNNKNKRNEEIISALKKVLLKFKKNHPLWNFNENDSQKPKITLNDNIWTFNW